MNKFIVCILSLGVLVSCNPKTTKSENLEEKIIHDIDKLLDDLLDPSLLRSTLQSVNAEYGDNLINSLDNLDAYKGDEDKLAMNMGIYAADVSYLVSFGKIELATDYVKSCHSIGILLGDSAIFKEDLIESIRENMNNEEELSRQLKKMIVETSIQLGKDHHLSMAALALTGSFIEELYQAVNVIDNYHVAGLNKDQTKEKVSPLVNLVLGQEEPLKDLIQLIEDIPHDDAINSILLQLNILDDLYKGELATIKKNIEGDSNYIADRRVMKAITLEIERIRESIVK